MKFKVGDKVKSKLSCFNDMLGTIIRVDDSNSRYLVKWNFSNSNDIEYWENDNTVELLEIEKENTKTYQDGLEEGREEAFHFIQKILDYNETNEAKEWFIKAAKPWYKYNSFAEFKGDFDKWKSEQKHEPKVGDIYTEEREAFNMAIQALKQEPSEDAISRQAAIDCCRNEYEEEVVERLKSLPPVTPARPIEKWIVQDRFLICPYCKAKYDLWYHEIQYFNYCGRCGGKMKERMENTVFKPQVESEIKE